MTLNLDGKPADFETRLQKLFVEKISKVNKEGCFTTFMDSASGDTGLSLVVVFDAKALKKSYYREGVFHVILSTPRERIDLSKDVSELSALSYIYFNGVGGDVNEEVQKRKQ